MFTQDVLARRGNTRLPVYMQATRKRPLLQVRLTLLIFLAMTILVVLTVMIARAQPASQLSELDLPQVYRPGSPIPDDAKCYFTPANTLEGCYVSYLGHKVHLKLDTTMKVVTAVNIQTQKYTIGDLLSAWGTPIGIMQTYYMTFVDWGTRKAYVYADSFRPDSPVRLIQYNLEPQRTIPWRGFRSYRN
jgi:hypothetical protein